MTVCPVTGGRLGSAAYTLVNDDELLVGNVIGERYHLREILGQGSTGTVFATVHAYFERHAAMKVLRPRYVARDTAQRVFHEARAVFAISHPSLASIFDIGTLPDGAPFFVMERLDGDTLAARLGRERFSIAAAVDLMMQLLSAMEAVHAHDTLLRDLRPQNIFLAHRRGCRPVLKILDVGLSRLIPLERVQAEWDALRAVVGASESTGALSIPYYLSPERTRSEHGLEPSSDIFVAAAIFYEALTGQKAFHGSTWDALLGQIAQARPTPLRVLRPDVPEDLADLVMRALSADPRARPSTATEMQDELRSVFEGPRRGAASTGAASTGAASANASVLMPPPPLVPPPLVPPPLVPPPPAPPAPPAASPSIDHLYEEETSTDHRHTDVTVSASVGPLVDEASADHPMRTVRPRAATAVDIDVPIDVVHDDHDDHEEETETMQLTPELRARIDQMTKATAEPASSLEDSNRPPPARRPSKAPRQR